MVFSVFTGSDFSFWKKRDFGLRRVSQRRSWATSLICHCGAKQVVSGWRSGVRNGHFRPERKSNVKHAERRPTGLTFYDKSADEGGNSEIYERQHNHEDKEFQCGRL
jgi:hypothetical protein